jgi:multidrug efflux pump subunit AcrA (membrane-fusion protein)
MDVKQLMATWEKQYEAAARLHEKQIELAQKQYESTIAQASSTLQQMIQAAERQDQDVAVKTQQDPSSSTIIKVDGKPAIADSVVETPKAPAAVWINAEDGERMLVLNKEAAVMFLAIFDRLNEVLEELNKKNKKK